MLNNLKRRALTLLLSLAMIITYMPTGMIAYAVDGDEDQVQVEQQVDADKPAEEAGSKEAAQEEVQAEVPEAARSLRQAPPSRTSRIQFRSSAGALPSSRTPSSSWPIWLPR